MLHCPLHLWSRPRLPRPSGARGVLIVCCARFPWRARAGGTTCRSMRQGGGLYVSHGNPGDRDRHRQGRCGWRDRRHARRPRTRRRIDMKRGFTSNGRENKASIVDLQTLKTLSKVDTGRTRMAMLYRARAAGGLYVQWARQIGDCVSKAVTGKVVATIPLDGKPEFAAAVIRRRGASTTTSRTRARIVVHRHQNACGGGDLADRAGGRGFGHGDRSGPPPASFSAAATSSWS